ncbi:helix-turn-helix domain-containing protein [Actinacidiphila epipremni]|jgi:transcriptional regulator with XRE-family HTH domain|uniref:Helix-turn-helix domain-containing protein n=1 Tax=Actinacidiphila epipremni TaxID=2053013 RepID=A0ABX0ZTW5_9ACTN|nr:helix-turn-helix transcriptional regulator [Actinacidiphila epipremni]NJP45061.1 helix-turn-helix domain-containing protein [Actinacidiphila epipremni]
MPTIRLRRLSGELRRLRDASQLTREDVAQRTGINEATLYRLETARVRPQRRTLMGLLDLYGVQDPQRSEILALSKQADEQGWLRPYHADLPDEYTAYISFEAEGRSVRNYESSFVPGLLQTEEYARAVIRGVLPTATAKEVDQRVRARVERRHVLTKEHPLELWAIVDEAALHRLVGGAEIMTAQLRALLDMTEQPHVTLQVIPFGVGAHPGMPGSFVLIDFPATEDPAVVYNESMAGDLFLEAEADIRRYEQIFDHLRAMAQSPDDSRALIGALAHEIT